MINEAWLAFYYKLRYAGSEEFMFLPAGCAGMSEFNGGNYGTYENITIRFYSKHCFYKSISKFADKYMKNIVL